MKRYLLMMGFAVCLSASAQTGPSAANFGPEWRTLVGQWTSEASAGVGTGRCAFQFGLDGQVLVRTNHAEVVATQNRPGGVHDDLMIIYPAAGHAQARATYWDNEGHVIEYSASWSADGNTLTFQSKPGAGPQFRLTYKKLEADRLSVSFDIASPREPGVFKTYTSGIIRREK